MVPVHPSPQVSGWQASAHRASVLPLFCLTLYLVLFKTVSIAIVDTGILCRPATGLTLHLCAGPMPLQGHWNASTVDYQCNAMLQLWPNTLPVQNTQRLRHRHGVAERV